MKDMLNDINRMTTELQKKTEQFMQDRNVRFVYVDNLIMDEATVQMYIDKLRQQIKDLSNK